jgi:hypothetical protein
MIRFVQIMALIGVILVVCLMFGAAPGAAAPGAQEATPNPNLSISDDYCLTCHGQPGQSYPLEDGSSLDLYVNPDEHANSIHGQEGYACVQCHTNVGEYPHPPFSAADRRDVTLQLNVVCDGCHTSEHTKTADSVHAQAQAMGNRDAAVCTDCHTAHAVQAWVDKSTGETLPSMRPVIPQTCAKCHSEIYQKYETSVHGSALTNENNPDVPTCIDCHGVHNIQNPTTSAFRLASPDICAKCHTDPKRMSKYGISTKVMDTYVADFHGTTVEIFEQEDPNGQTNKPVCYDCHGIHDIKRVDDPVKGLQVKENLLVTCQKCHPDAQANFPSAWLSHYIPSPDHYPIVYYVNLFYLLLIPIVLGGMSILVVMDFSRATINRRQKKRLVESADLKVASTETNPEVSRSEEQIQSDVTSLPEPGETGDHDSPSEDSQQDGEEAVNG